MTAGVSLKLEGDRELRRALAKLEQKTGKRVVRRSLLRGARIIRDEARKRAPVDSGRLRKSIQARSSGRAFRAGTVGVVVGPDKRAPHAHLVEFGTGPRVIKSATIPTPNGPRTVSNLAVGSMPAKPFLRPAFDSKAREAGDRVMTEIRSSILEEARK